MPNLKVTGLETEDLVFEPGQSPWSGVSNLSKVDPKCRQHHTRNKRKADDPLHGGHHGWWTTHEDLLLSWCL